MSDSVTGVTGGACSLRPETPRVHEDIGLPQPQNRPDRHEIKGASEFSLMRQPLAATARGPTARGATARGATARAVTARGATTLVVTARAGPRAGRPAARRTTPPRAERPTRTPSRPGRCWTRRRRPRTAPR